MSKTSGFFWFYGLLTIFELLQTSLQAFADKLEKNSIVKNYELNTE